MTKKISFETTVGGSEGVILTPSNAIPATFMRAAATKLSSSVAETVAVLDSAETPLTFDVQDISFEALSNVGQFQEADKFRAANASLIESNIAAYEVESQAEVTQSFDGASFTFEITPDGGETGSELSERVESLASVLREKVDGVQSAMTSGNEIEVQVAPYSQGAAFLARNLGCNPEM